MKRLFYRVLTLYLTFYIVFRVSIALFGSYKDLYSIYATLKLALPLLLFLTLKIYNIKVSFKRPYYCLVALGILSLLMLWLLGFPFPLVFGFTFKWSYIATIEYLVFGALYFHLLHKKCESDLHALVLVSFLLITSGLLYELPFSHRSGLFYNMTYPFFIYSAWIMLVLAVEYLDFNVFSNPKRIIVITLATSMILLLYYGRFPVIMRDFGVRLPFLLFWCIPLCAPKKPCTLKL